MRILTLPLPGLNAGQVTTSLSLCVLICKMGMAKLTNLTVRELTESNMDTLGSDSEHNKDCSFFSCNNSINNCYLIIFN